MRQKNNCLLLHFCCGPCGAGVIETLSKKFSITGYFYNPNIWPEEEYKKRLESAGKIAKAMNIEMIAGPYHGMPNDWHALKSEKEGGKRCLFCYGFRLKKTATFAKEKNIDIFTTTLSVSPHKNPVSINAIGKEEAKAHGINFYEADFKKNNGFGKTLSLSKKLKLYRQKYCGCRYSLKERN